MLKSEYLENRSLSTTIIVNDNILPFANYLPDIITEKSERKRLSPSHDLAVERLYLDSSLPGAKLKQYLTEKLQILKSMHYIQKTMTRETELLAYTVK